MYACCFGKQYILNGFELRNLQLEYVDLYLIHWPISLKPGKLSIEVDKDELLPMDIKATWESMEECHKLGLAKSIGVSNFTCKKLVELISSAKIVPAVNQVSKYQALSFSLHFTF